MRLKKFYSRSFHQSVRDKWGTWNVFSSQSSDPLIKSREILSTRLYITLVIISFITLTTYTMIIDRIENKSVPFPSQSKYLALQKKYANNLQCSCTGIAIVHKNFVETRPIFHQVCSSEFLSQQWIDLVFKVDSTSIYPIDLRTSLSAMWQLVRSFCQSANTAILDILKQFHNSPLLSSVLLTEELLKASVQATLHSLRQSISSSFIQSVIIPQKMAQANQLVTALSTNYIPVTKEYGDITERYPSYDIGSLEVSAYIGMFENKFILQNSSVACSCKNNVSCPLPGSFYNYSGLDKLGTYDMNKIQPVATLPGLTIDCLPIQSTFLSTLECFYNQTCLELLLSFYSIHTNFSVLNKILPSRFNLTTKIEYLVSELFVEEIFNEINYSKYYAECKPNICRYSYLNRFNWLYLITILLGLFGGITAVLRIVTPYVIQIYFFIKARLCSKQARSIRDDQNVVSNQNRLRNLFQQIESQIMNLNIYSSSSQDQTRMYRDVLSTWLYIILLLVTICISIFYSDLSSQIVKETIPYPTIEQYTKLYQQYSTDLVCPCTNISIPYGKFLTVQVKYHQICSSDFIRSWWYERFTPKTSLDIEMNFISFASSYFQTLAAFCDLANDTVQDVIQRFLTTTFVDAQLISNETFTLTFQSPIHSLMELTRIELANAISLANTTLHGNHYLSNMRTSTSLSPQLFRIDGKYSIRIISSQLFSVDVKKQVCYCIYDSTCTVDYMLMLQSISTIVTWQLEGIHGGCTVIDSVLKSSMMCWFKKGCVTRLQIHNSNKNTSNALPIRLLDRNLSSRYSPDTRIENIVNDIMIEDWNFSHSFDKFYHECKPMSCTFTYEKKTNVFYIVTVLVSLIGGINIILRWFSLIIITIVLKVIVAFKYKRLMRTGIVKQDESGNSGIRGKIMIVLHELKDTILMLNIFHNKSNDIESIRRQRISTRVYLVIFSMSVYIIAVYFIYSNTTAVQSVQKPSEDEYDKLFMSYASSLDCPCRKISIDYKDFVGITRRFHSVCSSDFTVKSEWRDYLSRRTHADLRDRRDVRGNGQAYFSLLSTLCQIAETAVENANNRFLHSAFINIQLMPKADFQNQIESIFSQFRGITLAKFARTLQLTRDVLNGNAFVSSHSLNWEWWRDLSRDFYTLPARPIVTENGCSCGTRSDCTQSGGVYNAIDQYQVFAMPGLNIGCSAVETLLRSTLECLYEQKCIDSLIRHIAANSGGNPRINMSSINSSMSSRFQKNTSIKYIIDELFIEDWYINSSYSSFYNQCAPVTCSYKIQVDDYVIYTTSKILGFYGGLTITLRFSIPIIVGLIFQLRDRGRRNTINPAE
ncbi:unnamed protein product [Adineta ricciae]|uniref:Uncharacterized protein n=1 Tax=Adineta ricciae TaxID=249248 RepID=A0A813PW81_ADIRI|nr:unnamed protein product [Adineta ricciae]